MVTGQVMEIPEGDVTESITDSGIETATNTSLESQGSKVRHQ